MIDENAFGILICWFDVEDEEYGLSRDDFVERYRAFRKVVTSFVEGRSPGKAHGADFGHAFYFELAQGDESGDPIVWLKSLRAALAEQEFVTIGVLSHGGRWVDVPGELAVGIVRIGELPVARLSASSEPLRRALYADGAAHPVDEDDAEIGWGPGLYVDSEAIEALGRRLKNEPTALVAAGATFYRLSR